MHRARAAGGLDPGPKGDASAGTAEVQLDARALDPPVDPVVLAP